MIQKAVLLSGINKADKKDLTKFEELLLTILSVIAEVLIDIRNSLNNGGDGGK